jgi:hypothetical protein
MHRYISMVERPNYVGVVDSADAVFALPCFCFWLKVTCYRSERCRQPSAITCK